MSRKKGDWKAELEQIAERLRDPFRMRITVACLAAAVLMFGIGEQLDKRIRANKSDAKKLKQKIHTVEEIGLLNASLERVDPLVLEGSGTDAVLKHVSTIFRSSDVSLMRIEPEPPASVGPFQAVRVTADFQGDFAGFQTLLARLDADEKLMRVESVSIAASKQIGNPSTMQVVVRMLQEST